MAALFGDEYQSLRESVNGLAQKKIAPFAHDVDENSRYPQEAADALQAAGLAAAHVPVEYGGQGADALAAVIIIEEVARVCGASSLIPAVNKLGSVPLMIAGNEEQKKKYLTQLAAGKGFSYCLSESEAGSDAAAAHEKKMGFRGSPTREVYFDNVKISDDRRLGEIGSGFSLAMKTLDHTRITIAAQALGIAQGAFDIAKKYAHERQQFGKPIFDFQGIQFMLADMAMQIEAARQLTYAAAVKSERGEKDLTFFSAASKCFATDVAMKVTTDAVQILGGYGYVSDYPVERMMRDAKLTQIYEGTNQIQRVVMARNLETLTN